MKWLPGGWQRADDARATVPQGRAGDGGTLKYTAERAAGPAPRPAKPVALSPDACDVDVSARSFRLLLIGGGISGFLALLCAASLAYKGNSGGTWFWQLVFGVIFLWFVTASRGMLSSRGFLLDRSGFYARTQGEVVGVSWDEIKAIGIGAVPWIQNRRPTHPERRHALEFYPADPGFPGRHPELDRWLVEEPAPMPGLPGIRYRFHLPPFSRLPRSLDQAVQTVAPRKWIGQYRREPLGPR